VTVGGSTLLQQQLSELNSQLIAARAQRAEAEARYQQIQRLLESEDGINSAAAVLQSPLIQHLREQETEIVRKLAEMKTQFREKHPKMILARSELNDLIVKIRSEVMKIVANLGNELEIARVRESTIAREVKGLRSELDTQAGAEITLRALEVEFTANQKLYDTILARLKETGVQDSSLMQADARIISYATVPASPSHPRKKLIVAVAFVGSLMFGVLLALLIEHLDAGFRTREQLEAVTGVAVLGVAPHIGGGGFPGRGLHDEIVDRPHSRFSEAVRTLRTALLLSDVDRPPCTVVVTSSIPGEGKTTTSLSLARTAAMHGQRCIIIDGDLRNASLHGLLGVENRVGLIDYLSRDASVEDLVQVDLRSGAHYILAGKTGPHPSDLLGSVKMRNLLNGLRQAYDLVIVDTPPVLTISDTLVLLRHVDRTMFLVRCEKTRRETALAGIRQAMDAGGQLAGLILSQVDLKKQAQHYGEKGYYYGRYHRNEKSYSGA
jgi:capsular exopolysaccharide synthesis family protein